MKLRKWYCTKCKYKFKNGIVNGVQRYICAYDPEEYVPIPKNGTESDPEPHCYEMIPGTQNEPNEIILDTSNEL